MKISEMNKILKEMKDLIKYDDKETIVYARNASCDPYSPQEYVRIETTINGINIVLEKRWNINKNKGENEND